MVREYDDLVSVDDILPASAAALELREAVEPLLLKKLAVDKRASVVKYHLKAMVGHAGAIDGVVQVVVTKPRQTFDKKEAHEQPPGALRSVLHQADPQLFLQSVEEAHSESAAGA